MGQFWGGVLGVTLEGPTESYPQAFPKSCKLMYHVIFLPAKNRLFFFVWKRMLSDEVLVIKKIEKEPCDKPGEENAEKTASAKGSEVGRGLGMFK